MITVPVSGVGQLSALADGANDIPRPNTNTRAISNLHPKLNILFIDLYLASFDNELSPQTKLHATTAPSFVETL
jgi:hypothetical protein